MREATQSLDSQDDFDDQAEVEDNPWKRRPAAAGSNGQNPDSLPERMMARSSSGDGRDRRGRGGGDDGEADAPQQTVIRPWAALLERAIEREVLPRLLQMHELATPEPAEATSAEVEKFVVWLIEGAMEQARALVDSLLARGADRDRLLASLLSPAARLLGVMWEEDRHDFATVTIAMVRLGEILRESAAKASEMSLLREPDRSLLLASAPGEQHDFGVTMLADCFGRAGWAVRTETRASRPQLMRVVRNDWFDLLGLSVSAERWLGELPAVIRTLRRVARNQALRIIVGGRAFLDHPERAEFVGADAFAADAAEAVTLAGSLVPARRHAH